MIRQELTDREYRLFSEWLNEAFGLRFGPEKRDILRSKLDPRRIALGLDTFEQLYMHLKFHPHREQEQCRLLPHLTNNESYFFREVGQLDVLRDEVLRDVMRAIEPTGRREIRILCAGAASGEEPFTLAMVARECPALTLGWSVRITGVDIDPEALARAERAEYGPNAFRRLDEARRERYFKLVGPERWQVRPTIRAQVTFRRGNIVSPGWWEGLPRQDIIFCRNVLIYFDDGGMTRAVRSFYECMEPGGYLFLGHAESLSRIPTRFEPVRRPGVIFHRKPLDG